MPGFGLCGQSYTSESPIAGAQITRNWYPEIVNDPNEEPRIVLYETPGLAVFATTGSGPIRGQILALDNRMYVVSRNEVYAVSSAGVATLLGTVSNVNNNQPVSMAASSTQLFIVADGFGYSVIGGVLAAIADPDFPASVLKADFSDGYFLAITSTRFYISAANDVTNWNALDFTTVQASTNTLVSMVVYSRRVVILGSQITQIFDNTGNRDFPYEADRAGIIPYGGAAAYGVTKTTKGFLYLAADERGNGIIVDAASGKVSSNPVDFVIQGYTTISDCVATTLQFRGHEFAQFSFPTAGATWRFDLTTKLWHEAPYWNTGTGAWQSNLGLFHTFAFNLHLMGSRLNGSLYSLSTTVPITDAGATIRRIRRCPHIRADHSRSRIFYDSLNIIMQVGEGRNVAASVAGYDPQLILRYSGDGGRTFNPDMQISIGLVGEYNLQPVFNRIGSGYDGVFEIEFMDVTPCRIIDGLLDATVGTN